jgi:hypothetical protein
MAFVHKDEAVKYPYFRDSITKSDIKKRCQKLKKEVKYLFRLSHKPFQVRGFNPNKHLSTNFRGKPHQILGKYHEAYDQLTDYYTEDARIRARFGSYRSVKENFDLFGPLLKQRSNTKTPHQFREYLFKTLKSCHNFRPSLAAWFYDFFNANSILDTSSGWGDRLLAACALDKTYLGMDPNRALTEGYNNIIKDLGSTQKHCVLTSGSEYLPTPLLEESMKTLKVKAFDLLFTSPPYFDYETYADHAQSMNQHKNEHSWLVHYMFRTLKRHVPRIKPNGHVVIYLQDVNEYDLIAPLISLLEHYQILHFEGMMAGENRLPYLIFKKVDNQFPKKLGNRYPDILESANRLIQFPDILDTEPTVQFSKKEILDVGPGSCTRRALTKHLLSSDAKIVHHVTSKCCPYVLHLAKTCQAVGKELVLYVDEYELTWSRKGKLVKEHPVKESQDFFEAMKLCKVVRSKRKNMFMDPETFLRAQVRSSPGDLILPFDVNKSNMTNLVETIHECLPFWNLDCNFEGSINIKKIHSKTYLASLKRVFPKASFSNTRVLFFLGDRLLPPSSFSGYTFASDPFVLNMFGGSFVL